MISSLCFAYKLFLIRGKVFFSFLGFSFYCFFSIFFQEWELLILHKLQWELTAITSIDYLDHALPRLGLDEITHRHGVEDIDVVDLRRRTETILVLVATDYQFCYHNPSLLAASAILTALQSMSSSHSEQIFREIKLRLQTTTHTATVSKPILN